MVFLEFAVEDEQEQKSQRAPNRFIQKAGVHPYPAGVFADHAAHIVCGRAEGFLIEEVAPATDRLTDQEAGHRNIQNRQELHLADLRHDQTTDQRADDRAVDRDTAVADIEDLTRMRRKIIPFEDDVIGARADDGGDDADDHAVDQLIAVNVIAMRIAIGVDDRQKQTGRNQDPVPIYIKRAYRKGDAVDGQVVDPQPGKRYTKHDIPQMNPVNQRTFVCSLI